MNIALAFGADNMQFYCYEVPKFDTEETGTYTPIYDYCILNQDSTPSPIYYSLQKLIKEVNSFSNVILSYDWQQSLGINGYDETTNRLSNMIYDDNLEFKKFDGAKHYVSAKSTHDLLVSRFDSEKYGEAYMFVNFADRGGNSTSEITLKDCKSVAIYGGEGFDGTPEIVEIGEDGILNLDLAYGEGVFVTVLS